MSERTPQSSGLVALPADQYHADDLGHDRPSLSASIAHALVTSSPRHAWAKCPKLNPDFVREEKTEFDLGTVAHAALLQPDRTIVRVIDADSWRSKAAQEARDAARADGMIPLLPEQAARVTAMVAAAREQIADAQVDPPLFTDGAAEQTLVWEDDHGVVCRARPDWLRNDLVAIDDLKTTSATAKPQAWARRTMFTIGADVQIAFYLRGVAKLFPELRVPPKWRYVVIETYPPYELSIVEPDAGILEVGRLKVEEAIEAWAMCLERDFWPGYSRSAYRAELPAWVEAEWLEGRDAA